MSSPKTTTEVEVSVRFTCPIDHGGLTAVPVWIEEKEQLGAKNWLARVWIDLTKPSGMNREFAPHAKGDDWYYILPKGWKVGQALEFGGNYFTTRKAWGLGFKTRIRWYGIIVELDATKLVVEKVRGGLTACRKSEALIGPPAPDAPRETARSDAEDDTTYVEDET